MLRGREGSEKEGEEQAKRKGRGLEERVKGRVIDSVVRVWLGEGASKPPQKKKKRKG